MTKNVLGTPLELCCLDPKTGYMRDGYCNSNAQDQGRHWICAQVTDEFLAYSKSRGNDLTTPRPEFGFPGLKAGDGWCLCTGRWLEALAVGHAPPVKLRSCHESALQMVDLDTLMKYALKDEG